VIGRGNQSRRDPSNPSKTAANAGHRITSLKPSSNRVTLDKTF